MRLKKITALFLTGALILSMAGCAGNGSKDKKEGSAGNEAQEPVKIATKPMTEQFILGEMLKKLIEEKAGYEVELTKGIGGGTSNIQPAMEKGGKVRRKRGKTSAYLQTGEKGMRRSGVFDRIPASGLWCGSV